jgi:four helix bundle protein
LQDFRELKVWEKGHQLALAVYRATAAFPQTETYALTSQLRRSASAIPSNIAEGCGRGSNADLGRFLYVAMGSAMEADYQLQLARELGHIDTETHAAVSAQVDEVRRMLASLIRTTSRVSARPAPVTAGRGTA